mmetsp:Transcript_20061/g.34517  ORF Transcript_20061/g.34517 Transcript_20061/m.34517 type:complete len:114 (-) Transcript_20061:487-828(-)
MNASMNVFANAVRVLHHRRLAPGSEPVAKTIMKQMKEKAVSHEGFITVETLKDTKEPSSFVEISTWASEHYWEQWRNSKDRRELDTLMKSITTEEEHFVMSNWKFEENEMFLL